MQRGIEILVGAIALIAVIACLLAAGGQPGSAWGALPGDGTGPPAQER